MSTEKISEKIRYEHCTYNMQSWSKQKGLNPIPIEKAEGIYMWDFDGNRYTDMSSQLVNLNVGHGNRDIIDAIKDQAEKYCYDIKNGKSNNAGIHPNALGYSIGYLPYIEKKLLELS